jgi:pimeloyl-ACP methyl ester carboxylesterase
MRMWDALWPRLTTGRRAMRVDLRGFGRSPEPAGGGHSHAADVAALIGHYGLGPAAVVGCSMSGRVALEVAVAQPQLVSRLVLVDSGLPDHDWSPLLEEYGAAEEAAIEAGDLDAAVEANLRMWVDGPQRSPGDVDPAVREFVGRMQRRAFELQLAQPDAEERLLVPDIGSRLAEVAAPTLVVTGDLDVPDFLAIGRRLQAEIRNARAASIAGAAHLPSMERPDEFMRLLDGFLSAPIV